MEPTKIQASHQKYHARRRPPRHRSRRTATARPPHHRPRSRGTGTVPAWSPTGAGRRARPRVRATQPADLAPPPPAVDAGDDEEDLTPGLAVERLALRVGEATPKNTVNRMTLPTMPTGHAHTRRRMPPIADANPKPLPTISRQKIWCPAMVSWALKNCWRMFMPWAPLRVRRGPRWWVSTGAALVGATGAALVGGVVAAAAPAALGASRRSTYLAMTSTSRLTGSPTSLCPSVVRPSVVGISETEKRLASSTAETVRRDAVDGDRALLHHVAGELRRAA